MGFHPVSTDPKELYPSHHSLYSRDAHWQYEEVFRHSRAFLGVQGKESIDEKLLINVNSYCLYSLTEIHNGGREVLY